MVMIFISCPINLQATLGIYAVGNYFSVCPEPLPNLPVSRLVKKPIMKIRTKSYPDSFRDEKFLPSSVLA
jgi:hypothetical protein